MRRSTIGFIALVATMVGTLAVLATLQFRWLGALSDAEARSMRGAMEQATREIGQEVDHEVNRIAANFQNAVADPPELARHAREWQSNARDARLVREFYLAQPERPEGGLPALARLHVSAGYLVVVPWPAEMKPVQTLLTTPETEQRPRPPVITSIPAFLMPVRPLAPRPEPPPPRRPPFLRDGDDFRPPPPPRDGDGFRPPPPDGDGFRPPPPREGDILRQLPPGRRNDEVRQRPSGETVAGVSSLPLAGRRPPRPAILIARLDGDYITKTLVPDLAKRFLQGDYDVAVLHGNEQPRMRVDAQTRFLAMRPPNEGGDPPWRLIVHRRAGAVSDLVERARQRNLIVGAAVLFLLAASIVLLAVLMRRAERLRLQQIEFVAGITHELNTPIAAVSSAGQNLADGIVREPAQVAKYGSMIAKEARRLSDTVAQVLDFAGMQRRDRAPRRETIDVASMIGEAVAQCRWLAEEHGVSLEEQVPGELPAVDGDPLALTRAVQNLIANAIRHGADGKWVGVSAQRDGNQVLIRVEDRGPGIAARDARHIFEPFYRGRHSTKIRGSGLGLSIVKRVAVAHGGSVRLEKRTVGAAFVLALPEVQHA